MTTLFAMATFKTMDIADMTGRTAIVTGANSGVGRGAGSTRARSRQPGLRAGLRRRLGRPDRPADQQRGRLDAVADSHRRRVRVGLRHQPPRPRERRPYRGYRAYNDSH